MQTRRPPAGLPGRLSAALFVASLAGWAAGLLHNGALLGREAPPRAVLAAAALGALLGGLVRGVTSYGRALYVVPFAVYCATLTFSTSSYVKARGRILNAELLVPSAAAAVPFAVAYRAVGRHAEGADRRRRRLDADE